MPASPAGIETGQGGRAPGPCPWLLCPGSTFTSCSIRLWQMIVCCRLGNSHIPNVNIVQLQNVYYSVYHGAGNQACVAGGVLVCTYLKILPNHRSAQETWQPLLRQWWRVCICDGKHLCHPHITAIMCSGCSVPPSCMQIFALKVMEVMNKDHKVSVNQLQKSRVLDKLTIWIFSGYDTEIREILRFPKTHYFFALPLLPCACPTA